MDDDVVVMWDKPRRNPNCVHHYFVDVVGVVEAATTVNMMTISSWEGCSTWIVRIKAFSKEESVEVEYFEKILTTKEVKPSEVQNLTAVPSGTSFVVTWQSPKIGHRCVTEYRLVGWGENHKAQFDDIIPATDLEYKFTKGKPCQIWSVQLTPIGNTTNEGMNAVTLSKLDSALPPGPGPLTLLQKLNRTLVLSSNVRDDSVCKWKSARAICTAQNLSEVSKTLNMNYLPNENGNEVVFNITGGFEPWTNYSCQSQLLNVKGWSRLSPVEVFETAEDCKIVQNSMNITIIISVNIT